MARIEEGRGGLLISEISGVPAAEHPFAPFLIDAGFHPSPMGFQMRAAAGSKAMALAGDAAASGGASRPFRRGSRLA
jgi:hypothetical protein